MTPHRLLAFVVVVFPAATLAAPDKKPDAPSTGKELATKQVVAPAEVQAGVAKQIIAKGDCTKSVATLSTALSLGGKLLAPADRIKGAVILQRCAKTAKAWQAMLQAQTYLMKAAPDKFEVDDLVEAYLQLGDPKHALDVIKTITKALPKLQGANLTIAASLVACHTNDYAACFATSGKMLEALKRGGPDVPNAAEAILKNTAFHAAAAIALGKFDALDADVKTLDPRRAKPVIDLLKTIAEPTRANKMFVEVEQTAELPLGTYHLMASKTASVGAAAGALVTLRMVNHGKAARQVKVVVEVTGVTESVTETISLPPGKQVTKAYTPPIKLDFEPGKLRAPRASQIALHVTDAKTSAAVLERSIPIQVLPRDYLSLRHPVGYDGIRLTFENSAAWITPNAPEIDAFLQKAKVRITEGTRFKGAFVGEQHETIPQVKALFDELKARGVSYVSDPGIFDERAAIQRTRLPVEVLASTNAQCLEGTLLYATLLEAIGLHPYLVYIKGHAFVAWKPSKDDKVKSQYLFLETTMTGGTATFEQAANHAMDTYKEQIDTEQFKLGIAHLVDVRALRQAGYTAQPY